MINEKKSIPRRPYGETGIELSVIGLGGVMLAGMPQEEASRLIHSSIDRGLNYFDVSPSYGDAEQLLNVALKGYREKIFFACKTGLRTKAEAASQLRQSLKSMGTDHFDLYQFHGLTCLADVDAMLGEGGAIEAFVEARQEGLIRHIGFSSHSVEAAIAAMDRFDFDSIVFPINFVLFYKGNFGPQVIRKAQEKGVAILAIKAVALSVAHEGEEKTCPKCWYKPVTDPRLAGMAMRFALSQPITSTLAAGDTELFQMALDTASNLTPITPEEIDELKTLAQDQELIFAPPE